MLLNYVYIYLLFSTYIKQHQQRRNHSSVLREIEELFRFIDNYNNNNIDEDGVDNVNNNDERLTLKGKLLIDPN